MAHLDGDTIHAYQANATDVRVDVATTELAASFSNIAFEAPAAGISKTGLTAVDDADGIYIDVTLTDTDLDPLGTLTIAADDLPETVEWYVSAFFSGEDRILARGYLTIDPNPANTTALWITPADVEAVYPGEDITPGFIEHMQALAEVVIGTQTLPISTGLKATFIEMVYRKSRTTATNADGLTQEAMGGYSYSVAGQPGLGYTRDERRRLRGAAGRSGPQILPTHRDEVETAPRSNDVITGSWLDGAL
jgi:hypothetical protein